MKKRFALIIVFVLILSVVAVSVNAASKNGRGKSRSNGTGSNASCPADSARQQKNANGLSQNGQTDRNGQQKNSNCPSCNGQADCTGAQKISRREAVGIALKHFDIQPENASDIRTEVEFENGRLVFEVEFNANNMHYEVDVDRITGDVTDPEMAPILPGDKEEDDDDDDNGSTDNRGVDKDDDDDDAGGCLPNGKCLCENGAQNMSGKAKQALAEAGSEKAWVSRREAVDIVLKHLGVLPENVSDLEVEIEMEKSGLAFDVEFNANGTHYEADVDRQTGKVVRAESEPILPEVDDD